MIEIDIFKALNDLQQQKVMFDSGISLSQFYGIEIDDFAHEIALLSLWLAENQMNTVFEKEFGYREPMLPLKASGNVFCANALRVDWEGICPKQDEYGELEIYICGNPPFLGTTDRTKEQSDDMKSVFVGFKSLGYLDFVASWFWKAVLFIKATKHRFSFVATNSICQGDQPSILFKPIFELGLELSFAYQTFSWANSARDKAAVHVVIIGFHDKTFSKEKYVFTHTNDELQGNRVKNISPYLFEGENTVITPRSKPLANVSRMIFGNKPTDGGYLYVSSEERKQFIEKYPDKSHWIRKILGSTEFINRKERFCFWLADEKLEDVMKVPELAERCNLVKQLRLKAGHAAALRGAERPHTFLQVAQPHAGNYLLVPSVSSEKREYVPIGFYGVEVISNNLNQMVPNATMYEFALVTSEMHNDWMRTVAGRLESRYRYSATLVYNTFPWPDVTEEQKAEISHLAEEVLLVREDYPDKTMAQLYNPETMPRDLLSAHQTLDKAVEKLYREKPFESASERLEFLFKRYEQLIAEEASNA